MPNTCHRGWGPCLLAMVLLSGTDALAQATNSPKPPAANEQAANGPPRQMQPTAQRLRSVDRPPPESGRPFIGPRTTQGLAEDAIARSAGR
jgi:hypothetical protein